jgi:hypothetical protein
MQISGEGKIGIGLGLLSLAGTGAIVIAPQHTEIGWAMIALAAAGAILLGYHHFGNRMERRGSVYLIWVIIGAVSFDCWYFWIRSPPPAPTLPATAGIAKARAPQQPAPPAPKPAWVTPEESEQQKQLGRTLLIYSPEDVLEFWVKGQNVGIYFHQWIKIDYPAAATPEPETREKKDYYVVKMNINSASLFSHGSISAYFDAKKWRDRLLTLRPGDNLKAYCQFEGFDRTELSKGYGIYSDKMVLYNCEIP